MKIKHLLIAVFAMTLGCAAMNAQTPEQVLDKMSAELEKTEAEGFAMDFTMKMPIVGEIRSHVMDKGDLTKMIIYSPDGTINYNWSDGVSNWDYDPKTNTVTISYKMPDVDSDTDSNTDVGKFASVTDGYDVSLQSEDDEAWYFVCKKKKTNKDKDDPRKMDLAVFKATYLPKYIRMKKSVITISMENVTLGANDTELVFNPGEFPGVTIVDKR